MQKRYKQPIAEKEVPKMVLKKVAIKWGKKIEYREVLINAAHQKFER